MEKNGNRTDLLEETELGKAKARENQELVGLRVEYNCRSIHVPHDNRMKMFLRLVNDDD